MRHSSHGFRIALLAGASVVALAAAAPSAGAADLNKPALAKAPPPTPVAKDTWTWWIEGGAFNTAGGDLNFGAPGLGIKPNWGGEGAIGFDWQPFAPMHVVGQFRYGAASKSRPFAVSAASSGGTTITAAGNQNLREDHWLVDFGIGRDFGLGNTHAMWTLGVRVADLRAKLTANGSFTATTFTPTGGGGSTSSVHKGTFSTQQRSTFIGAGPRFGVQGDIPLGGQWSVDWLAGAAVLFGERAVTLTAPGVTSFGASLSDTRAVFNVDAQAGLSYWFTPATKFTVGYRFDGYFKALKTFNSAGNVTDIDRFYNGPMVRLTTKF
ncbi:MAG TPA: Lpg1974 family pore-forming outer membrane protein [Terriglobia bacterium]|nr:Lpg1974 family pore-forming outer membrane protein [Terriglobia bacterium]